MTIKYITMNNRTYTVFFNNGSMAEREVSAMVRTANKQDRLVVNAVTLAKAAAIAIEKMHGEALAMDEQMEWDKVTPAQKEIHATRVIYGIKLKNSRQESSVIEACHAEALAENRAYNSAWLALAASPYFDGLATAGQRGRAMDAAHSAALEINANRKI